MDGHLYKSVSSFDDEEAAAGIVDDMNLCDDILFNILARLPARILYRRMRYVCKQWFRLITGDPSFAYGHLRRSSKNINHIMTVDNDLQVQYHVAAAEAVLGLGSCNGLLLLLRMSDRARCALAIVNPVTGWGSTLPPVPFCINHTFELRGGIAFDPLTKEYKVVMLFHTFDPENTWCCYILTLGNGGRISQWTRVHDPLPSVLVHYCHVHVPSLAVLPSILVNSSHLNWLVIPQFSTIHILSLDVTARDLKFQRIEFNQEMKAGFCFNLMDMRGGLGVAIINRDNDHVIWALDQDKYSGNKIWTKQLVIPANELRELIFGFEPMPIRIQRLASGEEVITFRISTATGTSYYTYFTRDLKYGPVSGLIALLLPPPGQEQLRYSYMHVHVDSLVSWP